MDALLQALAFELFHDDERAAIAVFNVVDGADVGVVELRGGPGLAQKALERDLILGQVFGNKFQRDAAAQADVLRFINHSHAADAQLRQDAVMGYRLANNLHKRSVGRTLLSAAVALDSKYQG